MKVLYLASEVAPYASTGEVGESAGALLDAIGALGVDVRVAMPLYGAVRGAGQVTVDIADRAVTGGVETTGPKQDPRMLFVSNDHYYNRPQLYGYEDEAERFLFFCKAALAAAKRVGFRPNVIHCNDWHTGLVPWLIRYGFSGDAFYARTATVFTIHNLAHQGRFGPWVLGLACLPPDLMHPDVLEFFGQVSFLKAGIVGADFVTALSPRTAEEIQTSAHGENMDGVLAARRASLLGILNGLDYAEWNPATDPELSAPFDAASLAGREANTRALRTLCDFDPEGREPIFAVASPLTTQYGLGPISSSAEQILGAGGRLVVVGRGDQFYEGLLSHLQDENPSQVRLFPESEPGLVRRVLAGSHFLLRPSLRESHGAPVMAALRYGCIPIATPVGPLADIVGGPGAEARGLLCQGPTQDALTAALQEAFALHAQPSRLAAFQGRAMRADFSWAASARGYVGVYEQAVERRAASSAE